jgi:hypothetical protein
MRGEAGVEGHEFSWRAGSGALAELARDLKHSRRRERYAGRGRHGKIAGSGVASFSSLGEGMMDVATEREVFDIIVAGMPEPARGRLQNEYTRLLQLHAAADAASSDKPRIEAQILALQKAAAIASQARPGDGRNLYILIGLVVVLSFLTLWAYFIGIGPERYVLIETTRPVLVFTLIIAMLGFGGTLIFSSLFSQDSTDAFHQRFRLAREIFLVYSGIFGTIIGFYFGAASSGPASADPPSVSGLAVEASGRVAAEIQGGSGSFTGTLRLSGAEEDLSLVVSGRQVSIQLTRARDCPAGAVLTVRDERSRTATLTVEQTAQALLDQGWTGCRDEAAGQAAGGNTMNAVGNTTATPANPGAGNATTTTTP